MSQYAVDDAIEKGDEDAPFDGSKQQKAAAGMSVVNMHQTRLKYVL
jgi:hypothetical protein